MLKFICENWRIIIASTAVVVSLISLVFNLLGWKRLRKAVKTDSELILERDQAQKDAKKFFEYGSIFLAVPGLIKEAEEVIRSPKSGSIKLGYVLQQIQKKFDEAGLKAKSSELLDYIESILATPEKKGDIDVSKAHETSQR